MLGFDVIRYPNVREGAIPSKKKYSTSGLSVEEAFLAGPAVIRFSVFVQEQKVNPAIEIDDLDNKSIHILAREGDNLVGTARVFIDKDGICRLGRMATLEKYRCKGYGRLILLKAEECLINELNCTVNEINAQLSRLHFYSKCGYIHDISVPEWDEEGMTHVRMTKQLT